MRHNNIKDGNEPLRTSRGAADQERSVLSVLRALCPQRRLNDNEGLAVAELQANRLLELAGRPDVPVPVELITELPRIAVTEDANLPASGMAEWDSGRWLISLNAAEPATRRRFSLAHEFKHVIDHRFVAVLYGSDHQAEVTADYFAACLWMPKLEVCRAWYAGVQNLPQLASLFVVSPAAMARRLEHLGLRAQVVRPRHVQSAPETTARYHRPKSLAVAV